MELELDAKFWETLGEISWDQNPPHMLNVPCRWSEERIYSPCGRWGSKWESANFRPFDYVIPDCMGISTRVLWRMSGNPWNKLVKTETVVWGWKSPIKMLRDHQLVRGSWQSFQTWRYGACYSCVTFCDSDYFIWRSGNLHMYDVMNGERPMC